VLSLEAGAHTVISRWCRVQPGEKVLIISDERHVEESLALRAAADRCGAVVALLTIQERHSHPGSVFHSMKDFVLQNDVIIGATSFSLVTNRITQEVLSQGGRFLSLPLSSNNGQPALAFDFMSMDPEEAGRTGHGMLEALRQAGRIHITTALGTDLSFGKRGRQPGLFNGLADRPGKVGSSSFEIYIGIEETQTSGRAVVDGSLGYLGRPAAPIPLTFQEGRLVQIDGETGAELKRYMDSFGDPGIYVAGELGIGLNKLSRCVGNCYIEDESAFTTFHIGMGRNLSLGGVHNAAGHFDLVFQFPTIYADDTLIMKDGQPAV
jgi:leucyl aminopeptidase (aminopeptidase T)